MFKKAAPDLQISRDQKATPKPETQPKDFNHYIRLVLPDFPLTAEDSKKRRHPPRLPYKLFPRLEDLLALPLGRRKAIEWSRARSIRDAYEKASNGTAMHLSVGSVFRWIQDHAPFEKPLLQADDENEFVNDQLRFCSSCGVNVTSHHKTQVSDITLGGTVCGNAIPRLPLVDVSWWVRRQRQPDRFLQPPPPIFEERDLVRACEPSLLLVAKLLLLRRIPGGVERAQAISQSGAQPYAQSGAALLGLLMEVYIRKLTRSSILVSQDLSRLVGVPYGGSQCIMRSHVFRALLQGAFKGGLPESLFTICAEIGTPSPLTGAERRARRL